MATPTEDPHTQILEMVNELNRINPFAQSSPTPQASGASLPPELADKLQYVEKLINNPVVQKYMKILADPRVQHDLDVLSHHPQRTALLGWELAWVLFMFILKAWRLSKSRRFFSVLWTQFWTFCLFIGGVFYIVPRLVLGEDYIRLVSHIWVIIRS